jgi:hypothetical protein
MALLQEKQRDPSLLWSETISFDEVVAGFLHWRENTPTSPSGRHLGVYRALITAHRNHSGEFWDIDPGTALTTQIGRNGGPAGLLPPTMEQCRQRHDL